MLDWVAFFWSGASLLLVAVIFWLISLARNDVSIVDSLWSLMFLFVALVYGLMDGNSGPRELLILVLIAVWALRLSARLLGFLVRWFTDR